MESTENNESILPSPYRTVALSSDQEIDKLFKGIKIAQCMQLLTNPRKKSGKEEPVTPLPPVIVSSALFCNHCNVPFENRAHQREHYKLDWHRYNLKQAVFGKPTVTEEIFDDLADEVSSISGSETESKTESDSTGSPRQTRGKCKRLERIRQMSEGQASASSTDTEDESTIDFRRHAKLFFENIDGEVFSIYRCLLTSKKECPESNTDLLALASRLPTYSNWAVFMMGGGHFAGAIYKGSDVVVHKTFHSYTVRAKQGGSQSSRDSKSGTNHPKSAGASLRRYNELSLISHVQTIMEQWKEQLDACSLIFVRAVGSNALALFGGKNAPLKKNDSRIRTVPFPTKRATFNEVKRVHEILSKVEIYGDKSDFVEKVPKAPHCPLRPNTNKTPITEKLKKSSAESTPRRSKQTGDRSKPRSSPSRPLPDVVTELANLSEDESSDDEFEIQNYTHIHSESVGMDPSPLVETWQEIDFVARLHEYQEVSSAPPQKQRQKRKQKKPKPESVSAIISDKNAELKKKLHIACKNGNVDLVKELVQLSLNEDPEYDVLSGKYEKSRGTMLHIAARNGFVELVVTLLELGADPCLSDTRGLMPYAVCSNKDVRNAFKEFRASFPARYNYQKAQIPEPPTEEQEQARLDRKRVARKSKKERQREEEAKKLDEQDKIRFLNLSDREKRALAAESRILQAKKVSGDKPVVLSRCFLCGSDITGKVPFEYMDFRFCTVKCLQNHRKRTNNTA